MIKASSQYQQIVFNPEQSLLEIVWKNTEELVEEIYKKEILWQLDQILHFLPTKLLLNTQDFTYVIAPLVQEWSNENILSKVLATGVQKIAVLIPSDLLAQISIEQQVEDNPEAEKLIRYFDTYDSAQEWL